MVEQTSLASEGAAACGGSRYFPKVTATMDELVLEQVHPRRQCSLWRTYNGEEKNSDKEGGADGNLLSTIPCASLHLTEGAECNL